MPRLKANLKGKRIRCLGPGEEHTFVSPDHIRVRVCPRCHDRMPRVSPLLLNPVVVVVDAHVNRQKGKFEQ